MSHFFRAITVQVAALAFLVVPHLHSQTRSEQEATSFVASIAKTVYAAAYPSATYKDWKIKSLNRVGSGLDLVVRFIGVGLFNDDVYVDLVFKFREGGLADVAVAGDNALFMPPFGTTVMAGKVLGSIIEGSRAPAPVHSSNPTITTHPIRVVSSCAYPLSLWMRIVDAQGSARTFGAWNIKANASTFLSDNANARLQLSSSQINFYGEIPSSDFNWAGDIDVPFGNNSLKMRSVGLSLAPDQSYELQMSCDNATLRDTKPVVPSLLLGASLRPAKDFEVPGRAEKGAAEVVALMNGMPAESAGLQEGDMIFQVDKFSITDVTSLQAAVKELGPRSVTVSVWRSRSPRTFQITPAPKPIRQNLEYAQCQDKGNPPDYFLGAMAVPFKSLSGGLVVPLFPGTNGRLFDPKEVDIYTDLKDPDVAYVFYGKPLRDDIVKFEYYDWDRALLAVVKSGEKIDIGVRIQCLIQPGIAKATSVRLSRTSNQKEVSHQLLPIARVN